MKFVDVMDPDIMKAGSSGHVALTLFGLPFFGAGCLVIAAGLGMIPVKGDAPGFFMIPFGALFGLVGLFLMTGRSGIIIDKRKNTFLKWYGLLVPMIRKEYPLDRHERVSLRKEVRSSRNSSTTVYVVRLEGEDDVKPLLFDSPTDYNDSRNIAERLSKFLRVPLADFSSGSEIVREYDKLDESMRDRAERTREKIELPDPLPDMISLIHDDYGTIKIEIPPPGFNALLYLQLAAPVIISGLMVLFFFARTSGLDSEPPPPLLFGLILLFFVGLPFVVMLIRVLPKAKKRFSINVSRETLKVEQNLLGRKKSFEIRADELEELEIGETVIPEEILQMMGGKDTSGQSATTDDSDAAAGDSPDPQQQILANPSAKGIIGFFLKFLPGPQITARSDKVTVEFGRGLSREELSYIQALIKKTITE